MHLLFVIDPFVFGEVEDQEGSWRVPALSRALMRLALMQLSEKHRLTYCALRLIDGERGLSHLDIARSYPTLAQNLSLNGDVFDEWTTCHFNKLAEEVAHAASFRPGTTGMRADEVETKDENPASRIGKAVQLAAHHTFVEAGKTSVTEDDPCVVVAAVPLTMLKPKLELDNDDADRCQALIPYVDALCSSSAFPSKPRVILLDTSELVGAQVEDENVWLRSIRESLKPALAKTRSSLLTMEQVLFNARLGVKLEELIKPTEPINATTAASADRQVPCPEGSVAERPIASEVTAPHEEEAKEKLDGKAGPSDAKVSTVNSDTKSGCPVLSSFAELCCTNSNCGQPISTFLWDLRSNGDDGVLTISIDGDQHLMPCLIQIEGEIALNESISGQEDAPEARFAAARDEQVAGLFLRLLEQKKALSLVLEMPLPDKRLESDSELTGAGKTMDSGEQTIEMRTVENAETSGDIAGRSEEVTALSSAEIGERADVTDSEPKEEHQEHVMADEPIVSHNRQATRTLRFHLVPASLGFASLYLAPDEKPALSRMQPPLDVEGEDVHADAEGPAAAVGSSDDADVAMDGKSLIREAEARQKDVDVSSVVESTLLRTESTRAPSPSVENEEEKEERNTMQDYDTMVAPLLAEIRSSSNSLKATMKRLEADERTLDVACILWLRFHQGRGDDSFKRRLNSILARTSISWRNPLRFNAFLEGIVKVECTDDHVWEDLHARFVKDVNNTEKNLETLSRATSLPLLRRASTTMTTAAPLLKKAQTTCSLPGKMMAVLDDNEEEEEEPTETLQRSLQLRFKGQSVAAVPLVTTWGTSSSSMLLAATTTTRKRVLNHFAEPLSNPDLHFHQVFLPPSSSSSAGQASKTTITMKKPLETSRSTGGQTAMPLKRARSIMETPTVVHATPHGGAAGATRFVKPSVSKKLFETPTSERRQSSSSSMMLARVVGPSPTAAGGDDDKTSSIPTFRKRLPLHHY